VVAAVTAAPIQSPAAPLTNIFIQPKTMIAVICLLHDDRLMAKEWKKYEFKSDSKKVPGVARPGQKGPWSSRIPDTRHLLPDMGSGKDG
jgi:hypothetical protein